MNNAASITITTDSNAFVVQTKPIVTFKDYVRINGEYCDATFDLTNVHPNNHEMFLQVILYSSPRAYGAYNTKSGVRLIESGDKPHNLVSNIKKKSFWSRVLDIF